TRLYSFASLNMRPPPSTPFPYTTLFRSDILRKGMKQRKITNVELVQGTESDPKLPANTVDLILMVDVYHEFSHPWEMTVGAKTRDRKSTRLNSSHEWISYAVFCLKKKNK